MKKLSNSVATDRANPDENSDEPLIVTYPQRYSRKNTKYDFLIADLKPNKAFKACSPEKHRNSGCEGPLSLEEFENRDVVYQIFKLELLGTLGIFPLSYKNRSINQGRKSLAVEVINPNFERINSAIECDFLKNWIENPKTCSLLIVIAMYNEQAEELSGTLGGIIENIKFSTDGKNELKSSEIGCIVIVDGIEPFLKAFNKVEISGDGCYRKNQAYFSQFFNLEMINRKLVTDNVIEKDGEDFVVMKSLLESGVIRKNQEIAHCFCQKIYIDDEKCLNIIFCVKQLNKRKLNTHLWFFEGFCARINPKFVMLLDVGTIPLRRGVTMLYDEMISDRRIAGCCGEIVPIEGEYNPIVQAQIIEYKFAHILDKALESLIGYVSVLPGAYSAYRWRRIRDRNTLDVYFKSQKAGSTMGLVDANMYLAEDRILCLELACQKNRSNILRYVKGAVAITDVPRSINELMVQRRRWINGSWFSMIYTIKNCNRIGKSNHNCLRKCMFRTLMVYYAIMALFSWVLVGAFFLAFAISLKRNLEETSTSTDKLTKYSTPFIVLYLSICVAILIASLGVKPRKVEKMFRFLSVILGIITIATIVLAFKFMFRNGDFGGDDFNEQITIALAILGFIIFAVIILLNGCNSIIPIVKGASTYIFFMGTYVNIFMIYAICNIHDCSWGNRPDKQSEDEKRMASDYKNIRTRWIAVWIISNAAFYYVLNAINGSGSTAAFLYINIFAMVAYGVVAIKFVGGILYVFDELLKCCKESKKR